MSTPPTSCTLSESCLHRCVSDRTGVQRHPSQQSSEGSDTLKSCMTCMGLMCLCVCVRGDKRVRSIQRQRCESTSITNEASWLKNPKWSNRVKELQAHTHTHTHTLAHTHTYRGRYNNVPLMTSCIRTARYNLSGRQSRSKGGWSTRRSG
jgi:hypothetical protein